MYACGLAVWPLHPRPLSENELLVYQGNGSGRFSNNGRDRGWDTYYSVHIVTLFATPFLCPFLSIIVQILCLSQVSAAVWSPSSVALFQTLAKSYCSYPTHKVFIFFSETESHYVYQPGLKLVILLTYPPDSWDSGACSTMSGLFISI